jgi:hypothetical protein
MLASCGSRFNDGRYLVGMSSHVDRAPGDAVAAALMSDHLKGSPMGAPIKIKEFRAM